MSKCEVDVELDEWLNREDTTVEALKAELVLCEKGLSANAELRDRLRRDFWEEMAELHQDYFDTVAFIKKVKTRIQQLGG